MARYVDEFQSVILHRFQGGFSQRTTLHQCVYIPRSSDCGTLRNRLFLVDARSSVLWVQAWRDAAVPFVMMFSFSLRRVTASNGPLNGQPQFTMPLLQVTEFNCGWVAGTAVVARFHICHCSTEPQSHGRL